MIKQILIVSLVCCGLNALSQEFEIRKLYSDSRESHSLGKLFISHNEQYQQITTRVEPLESELVSQEDFSKTDLVIIEFVPINSQKVDKRVYRATANQYASYQHGELISVVLGSDYSILAINYLQVRDSIGEINSNTIFPKLKEDEFVLNVQTAKTPEKLAEEESFFSKYKWPLIIFGVLLYTVAAVDPEKANAAAQKK